MKHVNTQNSYNVGRNWTKKLVECNVN